MQLNLAKRFLSLSKAVKIIKKYKIEFVLLIISLVFSYWLMFSTFSYQNGSMEISTKAWSDFASHVPLIRSFSFGNNFPPEYPLFSGPPIRYHFLFYAFVGILEKIGVRIDYALNIPSILGFSFLILMIYIFSKEVFKSRAVGILSVVLFLFNGSLSFVKYFSTNNFSKEALINLVNSNKFISFGPYDSSTISAFWNLNIYTNQRHLALSYALSLFIIYFFIKKDRKIDIKRAVLIGIALGLSFVLNMAVFAINLSVLGTMFLLFNKNRLNIFITLLTGAIVALPQYVWIQSLSSSSKPFIHLGYLVQNLNLYGFIDYWFQNLGLHLVLIPLAFLLVDKYKRKILLSFFTLFIIGNLIQFSPEIAANHKFFNLFMIIGVMYSSYLLVLMWNKKIFLRSVVVIFFILLILSGIMDFFPLLNDKKISLPDYPNNPNISWIMKNTNPDSVFLNTEYLYDNASLAGRKIFLGWPYFSWSQGYDTDEKYKVMSQMLTADNKNTACKLLIVNKINYIEINENNLNDPNLPRVSGIFKSKFTAVYKNSLKRYFIYDVNKSCKTI